MDEPKQDQPENRKRWSWKKRIALLCLATIAIWIAGDFVYSRVIAWRVAQWEATIQRNSEGVIPNAVAYSAGEGESAILFLHGINDTPYIWRNLVPKFDDAGYACRIMRLPGFGESTEKYAASDKDQWLAELDREVTLLETKHDRVYLAAHSLGAAIAINWSLENQDRIDGLFLLAPGIEVSNDRSPLLSARAWHEIGDRLLMFTRITETPFTADAEDPDQREFDGRVRFIGRDTASETFKLIDENRNRADGIELPLFMAIGSHDHVIDVPAAKKFFEEARSDVKVLHELDNSAHVLQVDHDWKLLAQQMLQFLSDLHPPGDLQPSDESHPRYELNPVVQRLEASGAIVTYESMDPDDSSSGVAVATTKRTPVTLMFPEATYLDYHQFADIALLDELKELNLNDQQRLDDDALWLVSKLKQLKTLNISGTAVTSEGMYALESVSSLETLYAWRTDIGDDGLIPLAKLPNLQLLNLFDTAITDEGLIILGQMKQLRELKIGNTHVDGFSKSNISQTGIRKLRAQLPETEIVFWGSDDRPEAPTRVLNDDRRIAASLTEVQKPTDTRGELPPDIGTRHTGSDWTGFLGPNTDNKSEERGIITDWEQAPLKKIWQLSVGEGFSAPSVSRGRLFLYHRFRSRERNEDSKSDDSPFTEQLLCVHSETGEEIWRADFPALYTDMNGYGDGPRSTPFVDNDRVYILSPAGDLRCLRTIDGELLWQKKLDHEFMRTPDFFGIGTSPIVEGDLLMLIVGGSKKSILDSGVVAFDKFTGDYIYGVSSDMASYASPKFATVNGRRWCFAFTRDGLLAFNPKDGTVDFKYPWQAKVSGCVNAAMPVVVDNQVFISEAYSIGSSMLKFDPGRFEIVWADEKRSREKAMKAHWNTPIYHDGFLYGCSGRHTNEADLRCVDWKTGKVQWKQDFFDRGSLLYVDDHFINLGENGKLTLFKATPDSFQQVAVMPADDNTDWPIRYPAWAAPVLSHGLLYIRGKDKLACFELIPK